MVREASIFLYTDFGSGDIYVGQMKAALLQCAPGIPVIDLLHEAPAFNVKANAHLLAALIQRIPAPSIVVAVVDPGVGSERLPVALHADGRWYAGPDNGLVSVIAARARAVEVYAIRWRPSSLSASFHGRDLFAPFAGMLARETLPAGAIEALHGGLQINLGADDALEIIYIDHYGNAMTGLRADNVARERSIIAGEHRLRYARVFSEASAGAPFWYENSLGLVEIAANGKNAALKLNLSLGQPITLD